MAEPAGEVRPMLKLAIPIVLGEIGWMSMGIVDTMMVGRLPNSAQAIGGISLGHMMFYVVAIFGTGMMLGLDTLVSQSFGAGAIDDCHRSLVNGIYLTLVLSPISIGVALLLPAPVRFLRISPDLMNIAVPYLRSLTWSIVPLLLFFVFRRYLQAMNHVWPVMLALVSANLVNIFGNWILIYGRLGLPAMGTVGSSWATVVSRTYMVSVLGAAIFYYDHRHQTGLRDASPRPSMDRIRDLLSLGFPAATQLGIEVAVFSAATALVAKLGAIPLASHEIALNTASFTYMVPLGIASATAVRVGQARGRGEITASNQSGWTGIAMGAMFMSFTALAFWTIPQWIVRVYTPDPVVIRSASKLLVVAAFFQLFDGVQTVTTGALRGTGDTRTPMFCHLVGYWALGLPLGYYLCFNRGYGAVGIWAGLSAGLILIGIVMLSAWWFKTRTAAA
jgi:MATE family multidrug resistance protein